MFAVANVLGSMLMLFSITYVLPVATSLIYRDGLVIDFIVASLLCLASGAVLWAATRKHRRELRARDGFLLNAEFFAVLPLAAFVTVLVHGIDVRLQTTDFGVCVEPAVAA